MTLHIVTLTKKTIALRVHCCNELCAAISSSLRLNMCGKYSVYSFQVHSSLHIYDIDGIYDTTFDVTCHSHVTVVITSLFI